MLIMSIKNKGTVFITRAAAVAALYVVLTWLSKIFGLDSGVIQFRISEMLCVLPLFTPAAIPGLFVGCAIYNLIAGNAVWDVVFGSLATLLGAWGAYALRNKSVYLAPLPTILVNAVMVGAMLSWLYMPSEQFWNGLLVFGGEVGAGEAAVLYVLGIPLYYAMKKTNFIEKLLHPKH